MKAFNISFALFFKEFLLLCLIFPRCLVLCNFALTGEFTITTMNEPSKEVNKPRPEEQEHQQTNTDEQKPYEFTLTGKQIALTYRDGSPRLTKYRYGCIIRDVIENPPGRVSMVAVRLDCSTSIKSPDVSFHMEITPDAVSLLTFQHFKHGEQDQITTRISWQSSNLSLSQSFSSWKFVKGKQQYIGRRWNKSQRDGRVLWHEWYEDGRRVRDLRNEVFVLPDPPPWVFHLDGRIYMKPELGGAEIGVAEIASYLRGIVGDFQMEPLPRGP